MTHPRGPHPNFGKRPFRASQSGSACTRKGPGERQMSQIPQNVTALLQALRFREARIDALRRLDDPQWTSLLVFSDLSHLTLLLPQLPEGIVPDWVAARVRRNCQDNARRFDCIRAAYLEL